MKLKRQAKQLEQESKEKEIADLHEQLAREARMAEKEREIAEAPSSQGTSFRSNSPVDSFTEDSRLMDKTETAENAAESNIVVQSKSENSVQSVHKRKFSAPMRISKPLTEADQHADWKDRTKADNGACGQGATSQPKVKVANKGTSKLLTAECIQNWSEIIVAEKCRQDFRSEALLVDNIQFLEEEIHLVKSEHSIVRTEVT